MNDIFISIIIPVYNIEKYLKECLDSILNQTYKNFEVILVDDCSTDSSFDICNEYSFKDSRIKVFQNEVNSGGCGIPRNIGLKHAKGDYITFVDGDDLIENNYLETLIKSASYDTISMATYYYSNFKIKKQRLKVKEINNSQILKYYFLGKYYTQAWGKLFPKAFVEDLNFPSIFLEDIPIVYKLLIKAKQLKVNYGTYYIYRKRDNSLTTNKNYKKYFPILDELFHMEDTLKEMNVSASSINAFYDFQIRYFLFFYRYSFSEKEEFVKEKKKQLRKYLRKNFFKLFFRCRLLVKFALLVFAISPSAFCFINYFRLLFKKNILKIPDVQL